MQKLEPITNVVRTVLQQVLDAPVGSLVVAVHADTAHTFGGWVHDVVVRTGREAWRNLYEDRYLNSADVERWVHKQLDARRVLYLAHDGSRLEGEATS